MDTFHINSLAGTDQEYILFLFSPETRRVQVPGPATKDKSWGFAATLDPIIAEGMPQSCIEVVSLGNGKPGYYAYCARPIPGGLKVQAPLPEYAHFSVLLLASDDLIEYIQGALDGTLVPFKKDGSS